jgi:hypothetical protein
MRNDVVVVTCRSLARPAAPHRSATDQNKGPSAADTAVAYNPTLQFEYHRPEVFGRFPTYR